jgi:hypothetical protein
VSHAPGDRLAALLERAFHRAAATDANGAIAQMRKERGGAPGQDALSYEAVAPGGGFDPLVKSVLPRLVYFLDCRGAKLPSSGDVFLSLFVGDDLYFLEPRALLELASEHTGLSFAEMVKQWGAASVPQ